MRKPGTIPMILGLILILAGGLMFAGNEFFAARNEKTAAETAEAILSLLPPVRQGIPENFSNPDMPVLELNGTDYCGLLQVPRLGITLPIAGFWQEGNLSACPRRYWGSAYDNSLIIGGAQARGQFDFCSRLDLGYRITFTDMAGNRFSYEVLRIDRRPEAGPYELTEDDFDLVLFVADSDGSGYIVVRCGLVPGM